MATARAVSHSGVFNATVKHRIVGDFIPEHPPVKEASSEGEHGRGSMACRRERAPEHPVRTRHILPAGLLACRSLLPLAFPALLFKHSASGFSSGRSLRTVAGAAAASDPRQGSILARVPFSCP